MVGFIKPYLLLFIIASVLSFFVVSLEGISIWFLGTFPKILFSPETVSIAKPVFSLREINEVMKYWTYEFIKGDSSRAQLVIVCILIACTFTFKNILFYLNKVLVTIIHANVCRDLRNILYRQLILLPVWYHDKNQTGNAVSLLINDIALINNAVTGTLNSLIIDPLRLIFFVSLLLIINYKLTLLIFVLYPVLGIIITKIGKSIRRRSTRELQSFSDMISFITEKISSIRIIKMFNTHRLEYDNFTAENQRYTNRYIRSERMRILTSPITEVLAMYVTAILLFYGGSMALSGHGTFTAEDFIRFLIILVSSYQPLKSLSSINSTIQSGIAAADRVFEKLNLQPELLTHVPKPALPSFESAIDFREVTFRYPGYDQIVLDNVSFSVKKGEIIAIVGSSGAGKTTILDLLPRFYEIEKGGIFIDGIDSREFGLLQLRSLFGIVSQESILFNDTIANNIAYGTDAFSFDKVKQAAAAANASVFIENLPAGYDTVIGERGVTLSGGQRQRLAIARALYKDPKILILDEATSALDTESERLVQQAIDRLIENRTSFVVAHRLSTIRHAHKIIVLERGAVVEQGSHGELLKIGKRYKYFYDIQFAPIKNKDEK